MRLHSISSVAAGLVLALAAGTALAQVGGQTTAAAKALYDRAVDAMNERDFAKACPQLEEAVKLEPDALGARMKLAECYEGLGKLASAWTTYLQLEGTATKAANQGARRKKAHDSAEALKPRLAEIVVEVRREIRELEGLDIRLDGLPLSEPLWGVPLPADRGRHVLEVKADGMTLVKKSFEVEADGARTLVHVPMPHDVPAQKPGPPPAPPAPAAEPRANGRGVPVVNIVSQDEQASVALYRVNAELTGTGASFGYGAQGPTFGILTMQTTETSIVCMAPCGRAIDGNAGHEFFLGGEGLTSSSRFRLDGSTGRITLKVKPGTQNQRLGGAMLIALGVVGVVAGPFVLTYGWTTQSRGTLMPAGGAMLGVGALFMALGFPIWSSGQTTYEMQ